MSKVSHYYVERLIWYAALLTIAVLLVMNHREILEAASFVLESPAFPIWKSRASRQPYAVGILNSLVYTLVRVVLGTAIGFAFGVTIGIIASQLHYLGRRINAVFLLLAPMAPIVWMPFIMIRLGIGELTCILTVSFGSIFLAAIVAYYLATNCRRRYLEIVAVMGASPAQVLRFVTLPSMGPMLLLLLRLNLFAGWMSVLTAEMAGIDQGLGTLLMLGRALGNVPVMLVAAVLIAIAAVGLDRSILAIAQCLVTRRYGAWLFLR